MKCSYQNSNTHTINHSQSLSKSQSQMGLHYHLQVQGRRRRSVAPGKGLEVPCTYAFLGKLKKLVKLIDLKKQSSI